MLFRPEADFALAHSVRGEGACLGDVFSFLSGLYFRGKRAYASAFAAPPPGTRGALVITSGSGLLPLETLVRLPDLAFFASVPIDPREPRYTGPLESDVRLLGERLPGDADVVLLGSVSSRKYVELLQDLLGDRLCFPAAFVGIGDMQRGALLLRAAERGSELQYVRARGAVRSRAAPRSAPGAS
jgi:hypothetical protein